MTQLPFIRAVFDWRRCPTKSQRTHVKALWECFGRRMDVDDSRLSQLVTQWTLVFDACQGPGNVVRGASADVLKRYCVPFTAIHSRHWVTPNWPRKRARIRDAFRARRLPSCRS